MSSSKHENGNTGEAQLTDDLERNPGIGQSNGSFATGASPMEIEGGNTVEGDEENDPTGTGSLVDDQPGQKTR
jgi:hypothetical protein